VDISQDIRDYQFPSQHPNHARINDGHEAEAENVTCAI